MRAPDPLNPLVSASDHAHPYPFPDTATLDELAARLGGGSVPGVGTLENDTYFIGDSIDVNFPSFLDFVLPSNMVKLQKVALSFKFRLFRAWSVTNASGSTGAGSAHGHSGISHSHSHGHNHNHAVTPTASGPGPSVTWDGTTLGVTSGAGQNVALPMTSDNTNDATGTTSSVNLESSHNHAVTVSVLGQISETTQPSAVGITVDGVVQTPALGGPFGGDAIELDITPYVTQPYTGVFHTVQLSTATQGRLMGMLRVTYIANLLRP